MITAAAIAIAYFLLGSPWGYLLVALAAVIDIAQIVIWLQWRKRKPISGAESLVGAVGVVSEACRPTGQVRLRGRIWTATCAAGAGVGERVQVVGIDGNTLAVVPASGS